MIRRTFLKGSIGLGLSAMASTACASAPPGAPTGITDVTALTEVFGDGMKLVAVAVHYDRDVDTTKLASSSFAVANRTITRVYANTVAAVTDTGCNGRYVIVELSPADSAAALWATSQGGGASPGGPSTPGSGSDTGTAPKGGPPAAGQAGPAPTLTAPSAAITQVSALRALDGSSLPAVPSPVTTGKVINPIVDDFRQLVFTDPDTGTALHYNLFVPKGYDANKRYPLVLFMHDASVVGAAPNGPLVQGLGAVCWASPQDQSRHECFVVAPQYPTVVVDDTYEPTSLFDATVNLVEAVAGEYSVDRSRMYATGQSMGAMMTIGMNLRHPDLFAASYVVAGQWPTEQTTVLARKRLWITVSQGDTKAYPGENAITALAQRNGAKIARAVWDARSTPERFGEEVAAMTTQGAAVNYVAFEEGTTLPVGSSDTGGSSEHMGTWHVAYGIPGIREWVMQQHS